MAPRNANLPGPSNADGGGPRQASSGGRRLRNRAVQDGRKQDVEQYLRQTKKRRGGMKQRVVLMRRVNENPEPVDQQEMEVDQSPTTVEPQPNKLKRQQKKAKPLNTEKNKKASQKTRAEQEQQAEVDVEMVEPLDAAEQSQNVAGQPQQNVAGQPQQNVAGQPQQNVAGQPQQNVAGQSQIAADPHLIDVVLESISPTMLSQVLSQLRDLQGSQVEAIPIPGGLARGPQQQLSAEQQIQVFEAQQRRGAAFVRHQRLAWIHQQQRDAALNHRQAVLLQEAGALQSVQAPEKPQTIQDILRQRQLKSMMVPKEERYRGPAKVDTPTRMSHKTLTQTKNMFQAVQERLGSAEKLRDSMIHFMFQNCIKDLGLTEETTTIRNFTLWSRDCVVDCVRRYNLIGKMSFDDHAKLSAVILHTDENVADFVEGIPELAEPKINEPQENKQ